MSKEPVSRRSATRRTDERRRNPHTFNSAAWIAFMQENYELWPKQDRRKLDRRHAERRAIERRTAQRRALLAEHLRRNRTAPPIAILTEDEKAMIQELFR